MKHDKAEYQLNKLHEVLDNLDGSYQEALELLDSLDVSGVGQIIMDKKYCIQNQSDWYYFLL